MGLFWCIKKSMHRRGLQKVLENEYYEQTTHTSAAVDFQGGVWQEACWENILDFPELQLSIL